MEHISGSTEDLAHLRAYGSKAYVLRPLGPLTKHGEKSAECIFLRYVPHSHGTYVFWDASARKELTSRNVQFDETSVFSRSWGPIAPPPSAQQQDPLEIHSGNAGKSIGLKQPEAPADSDTEEETQEEEEEEKHAAEQGQEEMKLEPQPVPPPLDVVGGDEDLDHGAVPGAEQPAEQSDHESDWSQDEENKNGVEEEQEEKQEEEQLGRGHRQRTSTGNTIYKDYVGNASAQQSQDVPSVGEAIVMPGWREALKQEYEATSRIAQLVPRPPPGRKVLRAKWVLREKRKINGERINQSPR